MTICIAAVCSGGTEIVLCTDRKMSGMLGSVDNAFKHHFLAQGWALLISADNDSDMLTVPRRVSQRFAAASNAGQTIDETNAATFIREAIAAWKAERCEELVQAKWGMSRDKFLASRDAFPDDLYWSTLSDLDRIRPQVAFIVAGFAGGLPMLYEWRDSVLYSRDNLAVVGSGEALAMAILLHRQHTDFDTLNCSLWNVFEAKKFAEGEPHVGKDTTMCILRQSGFQYLNGIGVAYLEELFKKNTLKEPPRVDLGEAMVLEETNPSTS